MTQPNDASPPNPSPSALRNVLSEHPWLGGLIVILVFSALTVMLPGLVSPLPLLVKVTGGGHYGITFPFLFGAAIPLTVLGVMLGQRYLPSDTEQRYEKLAIPSLISFCVLLAVTDAITRSRVSLVDSFVPFLFEILMVGLALLLIMLFASLAIRKKRVIFVVLTLIEIIVFYIPAMLVAAIMLI